MYMFKNGSRFMGWRLEVRKQEKENRVRGSGLNGLNPPQNLGGLTGLTDRGS